MRLGGTFDAVIAAVQHVIVIYTLQTTYIFFLFIAHHRIAFRFIAARDLVETLQKQSINPGFYTSSSTSSSSSEEEERRIIDHVHIYMRVITKQITHRNKED